MSTRQNKMKKNIEKIGWIVGIAILLLLIMPIEVNAALQANPNTQYTKKAAPTVWMSAFRTMEQAGGAMGLAETFNADLTSKESNNIDVHMMRSTEYGAIAILSASGYGNPSNAQVITTTTGNNTGVILNTNLNPNQREYVAGGLQGYIFSGVNGRYYDTYTTSQASARAGDALGTSVTKNPGAAGWHSAAYSNWVESSYTYFARGHGGIFSFEDIQRNNSYQTYYGRGVAVCGTGL